MAEDKKQIDKNRTLAEDRAIVEKGHRIIDYGETKGGVVRHDSNVTNTHKAPEPIKKK